MGLSLTLSWPSSLPGGAAWSVSLCFAPNASEAPTPHQQFSRQAKLPRHDDGRQDANPCRTASALAPLEHLRGGA
ncbi:hypothetical protein XA68_12033 [Ophiocordyceps unilateralis]|uniref:Uncharacterized protein n=1 Tax=Ophiocordyceps unilateralis TaxID=268505 RepID=A0A2A9PF93_OPHUN|nr:hypothetical protein XA68_12033 [Ophiocordyceps unilateralis]